MSLGCPILYSLEPLRILESNTRSNISSCPNLGLSCGGLTFIHEFWSSKRNHLFAPLLRELGSCFVIGGAQSGISARSARVSGQGASDHGRVAIAPARLPALRRALGAQPGERSRGSWRQTEARRIYAAGAPMSLKKMTYDA